MRKGRRRFCLPGRCAATWREDNPMAARLVQILASPDGEHQVLIVRRPDGAYSYQQQWLGTARPICGYLRFSRDRAAGGVCPDKVAACLLSLDLPPQPRRRTEKTRLEEILEERRSPAFEQVVIIRP